MVEQMTVYVKQIFSSRCCLGSTSCIPSTTFSQLLEIHSIHNMCLLKWSHPHRSGYTVFQALLAFYSESVCEWIILTLWCSARQTFKLCVQLIKTCKTISQRSEMQPMSPTSTRHVLQWGSNTMLYYPLLHLSSLQKSTMVDLSCEKALQGLEGST